MGPGGERQCVAPMQKTSPSPILKGPCTDTTPSTNGCGKSSTRHRRRSPSPPTGRYTSWLVQPPRCRGGSGRPVGRPSSAVSTLPSLPTDASLPCRPCSQPECRHPLPTEAKVPDRCQPIRFLISSASSIVAVWHACDHLVN